MFEENSMPALWKCHPKYWRSHRGRYSKATENLKRVHEVNNHLHSTRAEVSKQHHNSDTLTQMVLKVTQMTRAHLHWQGKVTYFTRTIFALETRNSAPKRTKGCKLIFLKHNITPMNKKQWQLTRSSLVDSHCKSVMLLCCLSKCLHSRTK